MKTNRNPQAVGEFDKGARSLLGAINSATLPCSPISNPNGTWSLVGSVPAALAHVRKDGQPLTAEDIAGIKHCGAGIMKHIASKVFESKEAAEKALADYLATKEAK